MDEKQFRNEILEWFRSSGKSREFQAQIRGDLISVLSKSNKIPNGVPHKSGKNTEVTPMEKSLNSLIAEYLMSSGFWYSASVFVSEAASNFAVPTPDVQILTTLGDPKGVKRHKPAKYTTKDVQDIVRKIIY